MPKNNRQRDPIPHDFKSVQDLQEFWDTHSLADYDDLFKDVKIDVDLKRRTHLIAVEPALMREISKRARANGVSTETLINLWLSKQVSQP